MLSLKSCIASVATATVGFAVAVDDGVDIYVDVPSTAGLETEQPRALRLLNTVSTVVIRANKLADFLKLSSALLFIENHMYH